MSKFSDADSSSYRLLLGVLKRIPSEFRPRLDTRPPSAPSPRTGMNPLEEVKRIDFKGHVHLIGQGVPAKERSISDIQTMPPRTLLDSFDSKQGEENASQLLWVHIPLNQTSWVNPCLQSIAKDLNTDLLITEHKYWLSNERRSQQNLPHSRHFEPSCFLSNHAASSQFVIYLPYLHWDSFDCFMQRSEYLRDIKTASIMDGLRERTKSIYRVMRDDCDNQSLHPRRSLDQFFYSNLLETFPRDNDQVVSKNTKHPHGKKKMIMVDQLWLWFLEAPDPVADGKPNTAVFTCFPRKDEEPGDGDEVLEAIADLHLAIRDEANSRDNAWVTNGSNFVGLVVEQAVNVMLRVRNELSLDFLNIFRAAIGEATEKQTKYFRNFHKKLDSASDDISDPEMKRDEVKLALEIADIIDELNSLNRVFEQQKDALDTAIDILPDDKFNSLKETLKNLVTKDIEGYMKQVKRMTEDARRTKDGLMDLLDLQQKEESLKEAHYSNQQADAAREQADETEAQSQILLLFTIVTIVFLPLSFFTSYYGMNVVELTGEKENTNQVAVWRVMGPISGAIIVGLLLAAFFMYQRTRKEQRARKERRKEKKRKKKQQSRGSGSMSSIQGSAHNSQTSLSGNPVV
ncbi:hypothetical protein FDECE_8186 [Fusarium decemcellulare]|nr:hypothetical protein FDECE_8186 [Fusarium decemcellulare]